MDTKSLTIDDQVCLYIWLFSVTIKLQGTFHAIIDHTAICKPLLNVCGRLQKSDMHFKNLHLYVLMYAMCKS